MYINKKNESIFYSLYALVKFINNDQCVESRMSNLNVI